MQNGWTQRLTNWVIVKSNSDTNLVYTFSKTDIVNLRVYITQLEGNKELFDQNEKIIFLKNSTIEILNKMIINKDLMLMVADSTVSNLESQLLKAEIYGKKQEDLKIKYQLRSKNWPKWLGVGTVAGFMICLLLVK